MADRAGLRSLLLVNLRRADYPVESPLDLDPALPDGPETRFEAGNVSVTPMDLFVEADACEFPYDDPDALVEDVLTVIERQER